MPQTLDSPEAPPSSTGTRAHHDLSAMIDAGHAFSGNERNCVFLNTKDGRFANFSSGSGLNFPDDGRAIAAADWDHDGDLDLWISNRNAPRLRLMRNESPAANHFLALRLTGAGSSNRDAIGARAEVVLKDDSESQPLVQTLRAGEGFLAQSSKWLHFGLGDSNEIDQVVVRWPDGSKESFPDVTVDRRYQLTQGAGRATPVPTRARPGSLSPAPPVVTRSSEVARIPVVTLLRAPRLNLKRSSGEAATSGEGSLLVNFWATWCAPCLAELADFRDHASDLRSAGVDVLALSVDSLDTSRPAATDPAKVLADLAFPFPSSHATGPLVAAFQGFHDHLVGLNQPLPVPSSFLIDPQGRISVIYKGPVAVEQVLADLAHSQGTIDERLQRAAQIPGTLVPHPVAAASRRDHEASIQYRYGLAQRSAGDVEGAQYYLSAARRISPEFAPAARELAELSLARKEWTAAAAHYAAYVALEDDDPLAHHRLAQLLTRFGKPEEAAKHYRDALRLDPRFALSHFGYASLLAATGNPREAVTHYRAGLEADPGNEVATNNLAWILATHSDDRVRDPQEALRLVMQLNEATGDKAPAVLDTLAAAQAASGNYQAATATAQRALALVNETQNPGLVRELKQRLTLYQSDTPYRQP